MSIEVKICELVDKYEHETNKNQSEADVRAGYIDLLLGALGWNVYNDPGGSTNYRREGYIRGAGIVDVGLEVAGQPALLLEAKRFGALPRSNERIGDRTLEEKQLFRYARGKKIPYCILTNFERLQVFNADHERLILWFDNPEEFLSRLSELLHLSPEKIQAGSLPATERQLEIKPIDLEFLALLQDWRLRLANAIYEYNSDNHTLKTAETFDFGKLMAAVQRLLDRLILIRYADDKEVLLTYDVIENILSDYHKRGAYAKSDHLMSQLVDFSHMMDDHHNTTLFQPGHICEQVFIPNNDLEKIMAEINNISFRKFTSDILGNTYETYLSTKLVLKNGIITSEERTDIRKAGGIYYTPSFIVHYIVDRTLGHLLKELENEHGLQAIEKAKEIRVVDPACGSGSFLIYAYQVLADYYHRTNEMIESERLKLLAGEASADMFQRMEMFKQLPEPLTDYPHHILQEQLYGVDIDPEAAEIAAVNLTMQAFCDTRREKLPLILNENIKVGNSLISGTEEELRRYFGDTWQQEKPFNWEENFPKIKARGGFDVVIGNPPYIRISGLNERLDKYLRQGYTTVYGNYDIYVPFIELGIKLLRSNGLLAYITPNKFLTKKYANMLRPFMLENGVFLSLVDTSQTRTFGSSSVYPIVFVYMKRRLRKHNVEIKIVTDANFESFFSSGIKTYDYMLDQGTFRSNEKSMIDIFVNPGIRTLINRISEGCSSLGSYSRLLTGTPAIDKFYEWAAFIKEEDSLTQRERRLALKFINVSNVGEYVIKWGRTVRAFKKKVGRPYLVYNDVIGKNKWSVFQKRKIVIKGTALRLVAAYDDIGYANLSLYAVLFDENHDDPDKTFFHLGLLNSKLLNFWYCKKFATSNISGNYITFNAVYLAQLPIKDCSSSDKKGVIQSVREILSITKDPDYPSNPSEQARVKELERQIDQMAYNLYGLTPEEIETIERSLEESHAEKS
jgi:adenine-specific DNA-methyltransferase